jgi:hypothetical protein
VFIIISFFVLLKIYLKSSDLIVFLFSLLGLAIRLIIVFYEHIIEILASKDTINFIENATKLLSQNDESFDFTTRYYSFALNVLFNSQILVQLINCLFFLFGILLLIIAFKTIGLNKGFIRIAIIVQVSSFVSVTSVIGFSREPVIWFLVIAILYSIVKSFKKNSLFFALLALSLGLTSTAFHSGMIVILIAIFVSVLFKFHKHRRAKCLFFIISIVFFVSIYLSGVNYEIFLSKFYGVFTIDDFIAFSSRSAQGGAAYPNFLSRISNIFDIIWLSPIRAIYLWYSPFIFELRGIKDLLAMLFSGMLFLSLSLGSLYFFVHDKRNNTKNTDVLFFCICVIILVSIIFGWGVTNIGTAIRHRDKFLPIFLMIFGILYTKNKHRGFH